jgi:hypothetical protein
MTECLMLLMVLFNPQEYMCVPYLDYPVPNAPPLHKTKLLVTSYWPYKTNGTRMVGLNGQCDEDCSRTANGWEVPYYADDYLSGLQIAACPGDWIGRTIVIDGYGIYPCYDRFGNEWYDKGIFYHDRHGWVVAVDLLHPFAHGTVPAEGWRIKRFRIREKIMTDKIKQKVSPAISPEARLNKLISLAFDQAQIELEEQRATSQTLQLFLKEASKRSEIQLEKLRLENELLQAKIRAEESANRVEDAIEEVLEALKGYTVNYGEDFYD